MGKQNRRNYYRILHVQPDAPMEVIRASYRTLMQKLRFHPDLGVINGTLPLSTKIAGSDLEQPQAGPKGGGQDARRNMTCMVPPRYGIFSWYRRLPFGVTDRRFSAMAGRLMYLHNRSSFWRRSARAATPACRKNPATLPAASAV
jgi:hypothetical protein